MVKDYRRLWEDITVSGKSDEAKAVQTLTEIVVEKEGRAFISSLDRVQAELCIEMLNCVCLKYYLRRCFTPEMVHRAGEGQSRSEREASLFYYTRGTGWNK